MSRPEPRLVFITSAPYVKGTQEIHALLNFHFLPFTSFTSPRVVKRELVTIWHMCICVCVSVNRSPTGMLNLNLSSFSDTRHLVILYCRKHLLTYMYCSVPYTQLHISHTKKHMHTYTHTYMHFIQTQKCARMHL
jgi:hypothetical protein